MPRPIQCRRISEKTAACVFKPAGVPSLGLVSVHMTLDELEALRLADLQGLYHEEAAVQMDVSRPTFGRILSAARRKVAEALVGGKELTIDGGQIIEQGEEHLCCNKGHRPRKKRCCERPPGEEQ